jgi:hypothetical protein
MGASQWEVSKLCLRAVFEMPSSLYEDFGSLIDVGDENVEAEDYCGDSVVPNSVLAPYNAGNITVAQDVARLKSGNMFRCHLEVIIWC